LLEFSAPRFGREIAHAQGGNGISLREQSSDIAPMPSGSC
jgi:hypothetical protein